MSYFRYLKMNFPLVCILSGITVLLVSEQILTAGLLIVIGVCAFMCFKKELREVAELADLPA